jgi:hypothetical protein
MTRSALFGAAALALTVTAAKAAEDFDSANYYLPGCQEFVVRNGAISARSGLCGGVVRGIVYMGKDQSLLQLDYSSLQSAVVWVYCLDVPYKVTVAQAVRVVVSYIEARPARMHEPFNDLALEALREAWPCK